MPKFDAGMFGPKHEKEQGLNNLETRKELYENLMNDLYKGNVPSVDPKTSSSDHQQRMNAAYDLKKRFG